jgi:anti-sigma B factor antagonist
MLADTFRYKQGQMDLQAHKVAQVQVLTLKGDLKIGDAVDKFRAKIDDLVARGDSRVVVDLQKVSSVDSSGIGALVRSLAQAKQRGGGLKLLNPQKQALQTLKVVNLLKLFEIYDDETKAISSFQ